MPTPRSFCLAILVATLGVACKDKAPAATANPSAPEVAVRAAEPAAASAPPVKAPSKRAACPTSVDGAKATVVDGAGTVGVKIAAAGNAADEVRARAHALLERAAHGGSGGGDGDGSGAGDGTGAGGGGGGGGGGMGRCPIVVRGVTLAVVDTADGALVMMKPESPAELGALRNQVKTRLAND
ncbi:MAG TPA: hypothetical protein VGI39_38030 [Polyangiaceae bacterium]|jgi:hypothetical protein